MQTPRRGFSRVIASNCDGSRMRKVWGETLSHQDCYMLLRRLFSMSIAVVPPLGCSQNGVLAPPDGFPHAVAVRSCAPNDGPAVSIYLSRAEVTTLEPTPPYLRIAIWQPVGTVANRTWSLRIPAGEGSAWFHATTSGHETASSGNVRVTTVSADTTLEGTVDVTFPAAGRIRGGFTAPYIDPPALCG